MTMTVTMTMSMSVSLSLSMPTSVIVPLSMSMSVLVSVSVSMYESWRWHLAMAKLNSLRALRSCSWTHARGLTNVARLKLARFNLAMKRHPGQVFALKICITIRQKRGSIWESIWGQFQAIWKSILGSWGGLGGVLGPPGAQDRIFTDFSTDFWTPLEGKSASTWGPCGVLGRLGAFRSGLEPFFSQKIVLTLFGSILASIWDPKTISKSCQNRTKIHATIDLGKKQRIVHGIVGALGVNFQDTATLSI